MSTHHPELDLLHAAAFEPLLPAPSLGLHKHLGLVAWLLRRLAPAALLEFGVGGHEVYFACCQTVAMAGLATECRSIDLGAVTAAANTAQQHNQAHYAAFSRLWSSPTPRDIELPDAAIGLLLLDARCDAAALQAWWNSPGQQLAANALVLCLNPMAGAPDGGFAAFWNGLKSRHPVLLDDQQTGGPSLLQLGSHAPGELDWAQAWSGLDALARGREAFAALAPSRLQADVLLQALSERDVAVTERDKTIVGLRHELKFIDVQKIEIDRLVREIGDNGRDCLQELQAVRDSYERSASWRLTAPLRSVLKRLRELRHGPPAPAEPPAPEPTTVDADAEVKDRFEYAEWIRRYDSPDDEQMELLHQRLAAQGPWPRVSVVLTVANGTTDSVADTLRSLQHQLHADWELLLVGDGASPDTEAALAAEPRLRRVPDSASGGAADLNLALAQASGDWLCFLHTGDRLSPLALAELLQASRQDPAAQLIYADEDQFDAQGRRCLPRFKCAFNAELLLACDLFDGMCFYRRELLQALGGLHSGYGAARFHELHLRASEQLAPAQMRHLPQLLRHAAQPLPGDGANARRAVSEHLQRRGIAAVVEPAPEAPQLVRVRHALPAELPRVSIVVPTRDYVGLLSVCIRSLLSLTSYPNFDVVIVDNGSVRPETLHYFKNLSDPRVRVVRDDTPFNFSGLMNHGARATQGELLCLLNNDIQITQHDWLHEMVSFARQPDVGAVGARLWYPSQQIQHAGLTLGIQGVAAHTHKLLPRGEPGYLHRAVLHQAVSAVTAACLVVRRSVFDQVHGFDETLGVAYNDVDFCLRVRAAGYRNIYTPYAELLHHESISRGLEDNPEKLARFEHESGIMKARWGDALMLDPAYNPNLTFEYEDFGLAWPPRERRTLR